MGDYDTEAMCLTRLIRLSSNPEREFNDLCHLLRDVPQDLHSYDWPLISGYLIYPQDRVTEKLKREMTDRLSAHDGSDVWVPNLRWMLGMILYALEENGEAAENSYRNAHHAYPFVTKYLRNLVDKTFPRFKRQAPQGTNAPGYWDSPNSSAPPPRYLYRSPNNIVESPDRATSPTYWGRTEQDRATNKLSESHEYRNIALARGPNVNRKSKEDHSTGETRRDPTPRRVVETENRINLREGGGAVKQATKAQDPNSHSAFGERLRDREPNCLDMNAASQQSVEVSIEGDIAPRTAQTIRERAVSRVPRQTGPGHVPRKGKEMTRLASRLAGEDRRYYSRRSRDYLSSEESQSDDGYFLYIDDTTHEKSGDVEGRKNIDPHTSMERENASMGYGAVEMSVRTLSAWFAGQPSQPSRAPRTWRLKRKEKVKLRFPRRTMLETYQLTRMKEEHPRLKWGDSAAYSRIEGPCVSWAVNHELEVFGGA
ncbi:hypothetical protein DL764_006966 [Monosporascus ibericus]|uniref:Uncharacterized protein n=1 Tax=Monosporascus ibericus TaxID=155417 RepID=A0A4Q4T5L3_9PEZI|nr:hypothetical protein DL764_006966 [Monosporascus ibericus]